MNVIVWIHLIDAIIMAKGCSNEIGIAVGVIIIVEGLVVIVITWFYAFGDKENKESWMGRGRWIRWAIAFKAHSQHLIFSAELMQLYIESLNAGNGSGDALHSDIAQL